MDENEQNLAKAGEIAKKFMKAQEHGQAIQQTTQNDVERAYAARLNHVMGGRVDDMKKLDNPDVKNAYIADIQRVGDNRYKAITAGSDLSGLDPIDAETFRLSTVGFLKSDISNVVEQAGSRLRFEDLSRAMTSGLSNQQRVIQEYGARVLDGVNPKEYGFKDVNELLQKGQAYNTLN